MIYQGCNGSLNLYYKGLLISSFALTNKKTFEKYQYQGEYLILKCMKEDFNIKVMIKAFTEFCNIIYKRKYNKQAIRKSDHNYFLSTLFALLKLKIIENDSQNGFFLMPKKKLLNV